MVARPRGEVGKERQRQRNERAQRRGRGNEEDEELAPSSPERGNVPTGIQISPSPKEPELQPPPPEEKEAPNPEEIEKKKKQQEKEKKKKEEKKEEKLIKPVREDYKIDDSGITERERSARAEKYKKAKAEYERKKILNEWSSDEDVIVEEKRNIGRALFDSTYQPQISSSSSSSSSSSASSSSSSSSASKKRKATEELTEGGEQRNKKRGKKDEKEEDEENDEEISESRREGNIDEDEEEVTLVRFNPAKSKSIFFTDAKVMEPITFDFKGSYQDWRNRNITRSIDIAELPKHLQVKNILSVFNINFIFIVWQCPSWLAFNSWVSLPSILLDTGKKWRRRHFFLISAVLEWELSPPQANG